MLWASSHRLDLMLKISTANLNNLQGTPKVKSAPKLRGFVTADYAKTFFALKSAVADFIAL